MPLNALRADVANLANSIIFGTCTTAAATANKIVVIDPPSDDVDGVLINGYPFDDLTDGLMFAVWFEHENAADDPYITFQLNDGTNSLYVGNIYCNAITRATANELFSWSAGTLVVFTLITSNDPLIGDKCLMANWQNLALLKTLSFSLDSSIPSEEITYNPVGNANSTFSLGSFVTHDTVEGITDTIPAMFDGHTINEFVLTGNYSTKIPLANGTTKGLIYSTNTNITGHSIAPVVNGYVYYKDFDHGTINITSKDNQTTPGHNQTLVSNYIGNTNLNLELTPHKINAVDLYGDTMQGKLVAAADTSNGAAQVRNITYSTAVPTASDGQVGDIWILRES